jgi:hypothetical protein
MISEDLLDVLEYTWESVCHEYEVCAELPDMQELFDGADLNDPVLASEVVLANMLLEVMECIGRFSPCYKMPGRAFGLLTVRDTTTACLRRKLAPEAVRHWQKCLEPLSGAIRKNVSLILATRVVDEVLARNENNDPCLMARCGCTPPHIILVKRSVLTGPGVQCEACRCHFYPVEIA